MTLDEMLAREEIRALIVDYNIAGDQGRLEGLAATFAPDGVLLRPSAPGGGTSAAGPEAIQAMLGSARAGTTGPDRPLAFVRHHLTTCHIVLESADTARARTYFFVVSDVGLDHSGLYVDTVRKVDGAWKIASREARIDWVSPDGHTRPTRKAR